MTITADRLTIRTASDDEMRALIDAQTDEDMRAAYSEMLAGCLKAPTQREWFAAWFIETTAGERIGELCFKGIADDGAVEIGYGLHPEHWGKGYATEAVRALCDWAAKQAGVTRIEAETDADNLASQRVLEKSGFLPTGETGEEGPRYIRRIG